LNPVVRSYRERQAHQFRGAPNSDHNMTHYPWFELKCMDDRTMLLLHRTEFVTNPPISILRILSTAEQGDKSNRAMLRVAEGIRA
jgi:hypothetical protein